MTNKIIDRILNKYDISGFEALTEKISLADLQSLLIEVYNQRVKKLSLKQLLEQYQNNRFVKPSTLDPRKLLEFDALAYGLLPEDYQILRLAPVSPLGAVSLLAPVSQNNVLTTIRNTEVCSDTSNVLALEAALQRKELLLKPETKTQHVRFCASHQLIRTQIYKNPAFFLAHFQIFSLCIAGRDEGAYKFEITTTQELIAYYIKLIQEYSKQKYQIKVKIFVHNPALIEYFGPVVEELQNENVIVSVEENPEENWNYYGNLRFNIFLVDPSGEDKFVCDGGDANWTQQLLHSNKERYMISGMGSELFMNLLQE